jgi:hypothetical protein
MLLALWLLSGLLGGTAFIISVNSDAGLPKLKISDLSYILFYTLLGPVSAGVALVHIAFVFVQKGTQWLLNKFNGGDDTTLIP